MITDKEFRQLLDKTEIKRYKNVNDAWTLSATYPANLKEPNKMKGLSISGTPKQTWAKGRKEITLMLYKRLASNWGFYGDVTPFIK